MEKGGYKCERSSTKIQPFLLFFSHLFLVVFSPVSAFSTFPFLHSWGRWFEVPEPVQKKCFRISVVLLLNSPRSHCSSSYCEIVFIIHSNISPIWLAKSTRIIHHNQLLMTKFGRILWLTRKWRQKWSLLRVNAPLTEKTWGPDWVVFVVKTKMADTSLVSRVRDLNGFHWVP